MKSLADWKQEYPEKFAPVEKVFNDIHRGDVIFIGSACAEPQYLVHSLIRYVKSNPKAFFDAEVIHIRTLGVAPYADEKFKQNFRHNSFFIGDTTREAVNKGCRRLYTRLPIQGSGPLLSWACTRGRGSDPRHRYPMNMDI